MTASIPPGWYEDPSAPGSERWWDGAQWTASTRARAQGEIPPPPSTAPPAAMQAGYPQGGYPGGYPPIGPPPGAARPGRGKAIGLSVLALVVVGGLIAARIVLLGGDDGGGGKSAVVSGTVTDPTTGLTVPRFKDWVSPDSDAPADQGVEGPCPSKSATRSGWSGVETRPQATQTCYVAGLSVVDRKADSVAALVTELKTDVAGSRGKLTLRDPELDKPITVDGHPGYILRGRIDGSPQDLSMNANSAWAQAVVIDEKDADGKYPCVLVRLAITAGAPGKGTLDTIVKGIRVGTPKPSESGS